MSDSLLILLSFGFLVFVFITTRYGIARRMQRASEDILRDLERKEAFDPITAVESGYARPPLYKLGMRDYHSKALEYMVAQGVVHRTSAGKYYLTAARTGGGNETMPGGVG